MRNLAVLMAVVIVAMTVVPANAGGVGQFGILDTSGINPATGSAWVIGDQYRLVFVTSGTTKATSTDIAYYNGFVQSAADAAGLGGVTWNCVGSTAAVAARTNTATDPAVATDISVPIYLMDGSSMIAKSNADLWDKFIETPVNLDENGDLVDPATFVFTGSGLFGESHATQPLGNASGNAAVGNTQWTDGRFWIRQFNVPATDSLPIYGMSDPLTVKDANAARNVYPVNGDDTVVAANPLTLQWTMPDSNEVTSVYADVFFGSDPCSLTPVTTVPADGLDVTSADVDASGVGTYYWRVDITVGDVYTVTGDIWSFTTTSDLAPTVAIVTPDMLTWAGEPVSLAATIDDDGESAVSILWTADPTTTSDPLYAVTILDDTTLAPTVIVDRTAGPGGSANTKETVTLTVSVEDAGNPGVINTDTVTIDVYENPCAMARFGQGLSNLYDRTYDCKVNLEDLAGMAAEWLNDITAEGPAPK